MTSIQNILGRKCVEVVTICLSDKVEDAADRMQGRIAALIVTNGAAFAGRMTPRQFNFMRRSLHGPSADVSGRASRLVGTPHRAEGGRGGQILWIDRALIS